MPPIQDSYCNNSTDFPLLLIPSCVAVPLFYHSNSADRKDLLLLLLVGIRLAHIKLVASTRILCSLYHYERILLFNSPSIILPRCWQCYSVEAFCFLLLFVLSFFLPRVLFYSDDHFYRKLKLCTNGLARTRRRSPRTVLMALGHRQSTVRSSLYGDVTKSKAWFDTGKF